MLHIPMIICMHFPGRYDVRGDYQGLLACSGCHTMCVCLLVIYDILLTECYARVALACSRILLTVVIYHVLSVT